MNQLVEKFGDKLAVLSFPTNQFGHQENTANNEILNSLCYVRPGNGYKPLMDMFSKIEVNGKNEDPLFTFLKSTLPTPSDNAVSLMDDPKFIIWSPVTRADISWNFEKFLIDPNGVPVKRFSKCYETINVSKDISSLL